MRGGVVDVAVHGLGEAAGRGAGAVAGADQMPQATAWQVLALGARVVAVAFGDGAKGHVEPADEHGQLQGGFRRWMREGSGVCSAGWWLKPTSWPIESSSFCIGPGMTVQCSPREARVEWMASSPAKPTRMSVAALSLTVSIIIARSRTDSSASSAKTDSPVGPGSGGPKIPGSACRGRAARWQPG